MTTPDGEIANGSIRRRTWELRFIFMDLVLPSLTLVMATMEQPIPNKKSIRLLNFQADVSA